MLENPKTTNSVAVDRHILLVEDDPVFAQLEGRVLKTEGYVTTWVPSGEAALELIQATPFEFDMVLLDLELGSGMSGIQTAEGILQIRTLPIVFVSGHTDSDLFAETSRIPSFGFIVKHAGNAVLRNSVAMAFRLWESLQQQGEQDRQFRLIMENLPEVLIRVNQQKTVLFASPALSRHCHAASLELVGQALTSLCFAPAFNRDLVTLCAEVFETRTIMERELTDDSRQPRTTWEVRCTPEWDNAAQVRSVLLFMRDITERKEAEEFRHLTEARLSCMLDLHNRSGELTDQAILEEALSIVAQLTACRGAAAWFHAGEIDQPVKAEWHGNQQSLVPGLKQRQGSTFFSRHQEDLDRLGAIKTVLANPDFLDPETTGPESLVFPIMEDNRTVMLIVLWGRNGEFTPRYLEHIGLWGNETARLLQKKHIRDALTLQSDHNRAILAASPDGFILLDEDNRIQDLNDAWLKLFGFRRSEVIGKDIGFLESGLSSDSFSFRMKSARYKGTDRFETVLKNRDGEPIDLELSMSYSSVGHHYLCLMRDIRVRKEHERKLLRMQGLLEETGRLSKTGAWDFSLQTQHCYWTDEIYRIFEVSPGFDLTVEHMAPFVDSEDFLALEQAVKTALAKETGFEAEMTIHTFNGKKKRVRLQGSLSFKGGQTQRLYGTLQDISRQHEIEADLNMRDAELRRFFEMSEDLLGIADSQTNRFLSLSPGWARSLGYETRELEGTRMTDLIHPDDVGTSFQMLARCRENLSSSYTCRYRCKDSTYRHIEWRLTPGGKRLYIVARDITGQIRQQEERTFMEERNRRLIALYQTSFSSEDRIIASGIEEALAMTGSDFAYCHFVHDDQQHIDLMTWSRSCDGKCTVPEMKHMPVSEAGIWADPIRTGQSAIHNNFVTLPGRHGQPEGHVTFEHHMSIPVLEDTKVRLIAGVGKNGSPYTADMAVHLELFMSGLWKIIQKFRSDAIIHTKEDEKKDLWKELNHRLKNTTTTIQGLLELEEQHSRTDEAKAVLRKTSNRIGNLMRTYQNLYRGGAGLNINLHAYLEESIYRFFQEYLSTRETDIPAPELVFHCPESMVSLKVAAALGLTCGELVSNGLHHAFDSTIDHPVMELVLTQPSPHRLKLDYRDNGRGFGKGRHPEKNRKLGLELIYLQLAELNGTITWDLEQGCACSIVAQT